MSRVLACLLAILLLSGLDAAPIPKTTPKETKLYFPTTVGSKWVYQSEDGEYTEVVKDVVNKEKERCWIVSVSRVDKDGKEVPSKEWEVSEGALILTKSAVSPKKRLAWPHLLLPHNPGKQWQFLPESDSHPCVAIKPQRVKVPAGEFDAVGVELYSGRQLVETKWYAIGIGLVKRTDLDGKVDLELKSFTRDKE